MVGECEFLTMENIVRNLKGESKEKLQLLNVC